MNLIKFKTILIVKLLAKPRQFFQPFRLLHFVNYADTRNVFCNIGHALNAVNLFPALCTKSTNVKSFVPFKLFKLQITHDKLTLQGVCK